MDERFDAPSQTPLDHADRLARIEATHSTHPHAHPHCFARTSRYRSSRPTARDAPHGIAWQPEEQDTGQTVPTATWPAQRRTPTASAQMALHPLAEPSPTRPAADMRTKLATAARWARQRPRTNQQGIALQTVIVIVVMLVIAGGVSGVLLSRGGDVISDLESADVNATEINTSDECLAAARSLIGQVVTSVGTSRISPQVAAAAGWVDGSKECTVAEAALLAEGWCREQPVAAGRAASGPAAVDVPADRGCGSAGRSLSESAWFCHQKSSGVVVSLRRLPGA